MNGVDVMDAVHLQHYILGGNYFTPLKIDRRRFK